MEVSLVGVWTPVVTALDRCIIAPDLPRNGKMVLVKEGPKEGPKEERMEERMETASTENREPQEIPAPIWVKVVMTLVPFVLFLSFFVLEHWYTRP